MRDFEQRKRDHLALALDASHQSVNSFDAYELMHHALPEHNFDQLSLAIQSLGKQRPTPFVITGMTAGHDAAVPFNKALAEACARRGWAFGFGSQRKQIDASDKAVGDLRDTFPTLELFGNIGLSQVMHKNQIVQLAQGMDAFVIHINPLQEVLQEEGTPHFAGWYEALAALIDAMPCPVIVKETGCGFSEKPLKRLESLGIMAIDVAGVGGTHWGRIEGARALGLRKQAAETFKNWGVSTPASIALGKKHTTKEIWGSGGIRSGLDAAKALALGATRVGYARSALIAYQAGKLDAWMELQEFELKVALFCTNSRVPQDLIHA